MMNKKMHVNPRIIEHLGSDLITSSSVAMLELIKNSLDAKSKKVNIQLLDSLNYIDENVFLTEVNQQVIDIFPKKVTAESVLVIEDIGSGMNERILDNGFLNIGTDIKYNNKNEGDVCLGQKGIGRLAAQRLGKVLVVETASEDEDNSNIIIIDWDILSMAKAIDMIELPYYRCDKKAKSYTRLWIFGVNIEDILEIPEQVTVFQDVDAKLISELSSAVSFIISPFRKSRIKPEIEFWYNNSKIDYEIDIKLLEFAESIHSFKVVGEGDKISLDLSLVLKPWFIEKTHRSSVKPTTIFSKYKLSYEQYSALYDKYKEKYEVSLTRHVCYNDLVEKIKELRKKSFVKIADQESLDLYLKGKIEKDIKKLMEILPIEGEAYSFKQDSSIGKMYVEFAKYLAINEELSNYELPDIKIFLSQYNGVKLYRNDYRIGTLGNKTDDWIQMQQFRTLGQQFYRFNQGNTLGYVSINDPTQEKIREISSRLDIFENDVAKVFKEFIVIVFNYYFYEFNRTADDITKIILRDEGLLPVDTKQKIKNNNKMNKELIEQNKKLLKEIKKTKQLLSDKVRVDGDKVNISMETYTRAIETLDATDSQIQKAQEHFNLTQEILDEAKKGLQAIEIEAFNNYKLMANGLITETITHELHSVINNEYAINMDMHFEALKMYLYENNIPLYGKHLLPIKDQSEMMISKVEDISDLYNFLEKTFIRKNSFEEYAVENIEEVVLSIENKLFRELHKKNVKIVTKDISNSWYMPKGVLLHVLYNLIANAMYWIDIRKKRAQLDEAYNMHSEDKIIIEQLASDNLIISDTGTGIIKRMEYVLFEPLQSGKESEGRGMGLYIVKKLLNSFNADIELLDRRNEYGNKYIFSITVPDECTR